jgi:DNA polymerase-1
MEEVVLDIESDGLLDTITKVHLLVYRNLNTGELTIADSDSKIKKALIDLSDKKIIGHNILGYDLIALKRLYGFTIPIDQTLDFNTFKSYLC